MKSNEDSKNIEEEIKECPEDHSLEKEEKPNLFEVIDNFSKIIILKSVLTRPL